jgi:hypothetical protein
VRPARRRRRGASHVGALCLLLRCLELGSSKIVMPWRACRSSSWAPSCPGMTGAAPPSSVVRHERRRAFSARALPLYCTSLSTSRREECGGVLTVAGNLITSEESAGDHPSSVSPSLLRRGSNRPRAEPPLLGRPEWEEWIRFCLFDLFQMFVLYSNFVNSYILF